jgi:hypothetical protein
MQKAARAEKAIGDRFIGIHKVRDEASRLGYRQLTSDIQEWLDQGEEVEDKIKQFLANYSKQVEHQDSI